MAHCSDDTEIDMLLPVVEGLFNQGLSLLVQPKGSDARSLGTQIQSMDDIMCWEGQQHQPIIKATFLTTQTGILEFATNL